MEDIFEYIKKFDSKEKNWAGIIIHHSATKDGAVNDWETIRRWHTGKIGSADLLSPNYNKYIHRPSRDIGYHAGIEYFNGELVYRIGRPLNWEGGHTLYHNAFNIGICVVGNFDMEEPRHEQYVMCGKICKAILHKWPIPIDMVRPHWVYADKTCPGRLFNMLKLRDYIRDIEI